MTNKKSKNLTIVEVPIDQLNPAPYNPRVDLKPGDSDYERLKQSMHTFGYVKPLVWNKKTGNLVGGHQRFKILIEQGFTEVDVSVVELSLKKEKAFCRISTSLLFLIFLMS